MLLFVNTFVIVCRHLLLLLFTLLLLFVYTFLIVIVCLPFCFCYCLFAFLLLLLFVFTFCLSAFLLLLFFIFIVILIFLKFQKSGAISRTHSKVYLNGFFGEAVKVYLGRSEFLYKMWLAETFLQPVAVIYFLHYLCPLAHPLLSVLRQLTIESLSILFLLGLFITAELAYAQLPGNLISLSALLFFWTEAWHGKFHNPNFSSIKAGSGHFTPEQRCLFLCYKFCGQGLTKFII